MAVKCSVRVCAHANHRATFLKEQIQLYYINPKVLFRELTAEEKM